MTSYRKTMRESREEMLVISEAKYELYHKDFSTAMQHAYKMAKKLHGITVDPKEIDDKVASGPSKPSEGKTNSYRLEGDKGAIQIQVYNKGGSKPYELNFYKEEVELDEVGGSAFGGTIDKIQKVVDDKQATKIDGVMVDTFTASLIMKIWNGVSKQNQDKMRKMKVTQLAKAAYKLAGMKEEVDLDEKKKDVVFKGTPKQIKQQMKDLKKKKDKVKIGEELDEAKISVSGFISGSERKKFDDTMKKMRLNFQAVDLDSYEADTSTIRAIAKLAKTMGYKYSMHEEADLDEADDFKPHMMYDPKTGKGYKADTMDDHLRMKKMGYTHDAPKKEEVELDEGKMKDLVIKGQDLEAYAKKSGGIDKKDMMKVAAMMKKGDKSGALKYAKKLDTDPRDYILDLMGEEVEVEEGAAADARRAMSKDKDLRRGKDSADVDDNASDDDVKGASKNIIMQMRKAQSLSGNFAVEFGDGKKVKIPAKMAVAVQKKYNSMKKPADKEKFQAQIAKSYKDMLKTLEAGYGEQKESILERMNRKIKENKDG